METRKVVLWGHKLHTHTQSYIFYAYYKAFIAMGFDTAWFDNSDDVTGINFDNVIFFTEHQVDGRIPINKTSTYILQQDFDNPKYDGCKTLKLLSYVEDCAKGISYNLKPDTVEKINYYTYYDKKNKALYQPWGTDLLPHEFADEPRPVNRQSSVINYIGTVREDNLKEFKRFREGCTKNGIALNIPRNVWKTTRKLVEDSYVSPDVRPQMHVDVGYVPCRVFKNISYGCIPATHSPHIRDFFWANALPYSADPYDLVAVNVAYLDDLANVENSRGLMEEVKKHHTHITRIENILKLI